MTSIGLAAAPVPAIYQDRAAYVQRLVDASGGTKRAEDITAESEASDQMHLQQAQNEVDYLDGKAIPVNGTTKEMAANALAQAREARSDHYKYVSGPVLIEAMNINSAVKAQSTLTGGDLKDLSKYAEYLRGEVDAAARARPDVTFSGTWGTDRSTNDVSEYISWLFQAAQGSSSSSK